MEKALLITKRGTGYIAASVIAASVKDIVAALIFNAISEGR